MLAETAQLVRDFGTMFVRSPGPSAQTTELFERCKALNAKGRDLPPRLGVSPFSGADQAEMVDPLSSVVTDACSSVLPRLADPTGYPALSAYINETMLGKRVPAVREQPWRLLGLDGAPRSLGDLAEALSEIDAVVAELSADPDSNRSIVNVARSGTADGALARAADRALRRTRRRFGERQKAIAAHLKSAGLRTEVVWSAGDRLRGEFPNFAVTVAVESLTDWPAAMEELVPRVEALRISGESPWLVPLLGGRTVRSCTQQLISRLWPVTDFSEFEHSLPHPLEERLTTEVVAAHSALQVRSALSVFGREDSFDEQVARVLEQAQSDFTEAVSAIRGLGHDAAISEIVDWLVEVDARIEGEWEGEVGAGTFAEGIIEGVLGDGSFEFGTLDAALLVSLEWDADPANAVALIEHLRE